MQPAPMLLAASARAALSTYSAYVLLPKPASASYVFARRHARRGRSKIEETRRPGKSEREDAVIADMSVDIPDRHHREAQ